MFTQQITIAGTAAYVAERADGRIVLFSPSKSTVKVLTAEAFQAQREMLAVQGIRCESIPAGVVAGAGVSIVEMVMARFREMVVNTSFYPEEWELRNA